MFHKAETKVLIFNWKLRNTKILYKLIEVPKEVLAINENFQNRPIVLAIKSLVW